MLPSPNIPAERVRLAIQSRFSPIRDITPKSLATQIDDFRCGSLGIARLWDAIRLRDDILTSVCAKRLDAIGSLRWEILINEDAAEGRTAEAQRHQEILEAFYDGLEFTDILNQDMAGGVCLLARHLLLARFDKHAVAEWMWRPRQLGGQSYTTATFAGCPLWWFEGRTGRLRYLPSDYAYDGTPLDPMGWLAATAPHHLMEAASVAWMYKILPLRDWLSFSEKFGMPGLLGKTDAQKGTEEWDALKDAVGNFGQDWAAVVNRNAEIEPLSVSAAAGTLPYPPLVDMMNRSLSALIRGADLSTLSAGTGSGQGASLQGEEKDDIGTGDAMFVSELLQRKVDRQVLAYELGWKEKPLAYLQITPKQKPNVDADVKVDEFLLKHGVELGKEDLRARYNRPAPSDGEELVETPADPATDPNAPVDPAQSREVADMADLANAYDLQQKRDIRDAALKELAKAFAAYLAPVRERLVEIANTADPASQRLAAGQLRAMLPQFLRDRGTEPEVVAAFEGALGQSLVDGLVADAAYVRRARA